MDEKDKIVNELFDVVDELCARELSNNSVYEKYTRISYDELCNTIIKLAAKLKAPKEMDLELCFKDSHYSYCNTVADLIDDALYVESLS